MGVARTNTLVTGLIAAAVVIGALLWSASLGSDTAVRTDPAPAQPTAVEVSSGPRSMDSAPVEVPKDGSAMVKGRVNSEEARAALAG